MMAWIEQTIKELKTNPDQKKSSIVAAAVSRLLGYLDCNQCYQMIK